MIQVRFACGHINSFSGDEEPICVCGETRREEVKAPAPRFRGTATGPCSQYVELPAKAVQFKERT